MRSRAILPLLLLGALGCKSKPAPAAAPPLPVSLFAGERGLDHVGIAVKDLTAARQTFNGALGFGGFEEGRLPNGIANLNYYFEDSTYLETLNAWSAGKASCRAMTRPTVKPAMPQIMAATVENLTGPIL